jgi:hypothetical protein
MYFRYIIFLFFCYCFTIKATAQQLYTIKGTVYKKSSPDRVAQVIVKNLHTNTIMMSDDLGGFHIEGSTGDTVLFKKTDYAAQYMVIANANDVNIYLQPIIMLNQVTIKDQSKKEELNDVLKQYKTVGGYYTLSPSAWSMINSPLTGFYELFSPSVNRARKFTAYSKEELEHQQIAKRYNKGIITKVTGVTDDKELQGFMDAFSPAYEDVKLWSDYDLINYIKKSYAYYKDNRNNLKLPKLY